MREEGLRCGIMVCRARQRGLGRPINLLANPAVAGYASEKLLSPTQKSSKGLHFLALQMHGSAANDMANLPRQTELEQACKKAVRPNHDYVDAVENNLQRHSKVTPSSSCQTPARPAWQDASLLQQATSSIERTMLAPCALCSQ